MGMEEHNISNQPTKRRRKRGPGAPPGNKNALKHGLYSTQLTARERRMLLQARRMQGVGDELAVFRVKFAQMLSDPWLNLRALTMALTAVTRAEALQHKIREVEGKKTTLADNLAGFFAGVGEAMGWDEEEEGFGEGAEAGFEEEAEEGFGEGDEAGFEDRGGRGGLRTWEGDEAEGYGGNRGGRRRVHADRLRADLGLGLGVRWRARTAAGASARRAAGTGDEGGLSGYRPCIGVRGRLSAGMTVKVCGMADSVGVSAPIPTFPRLAGEGVDRAGGGGEAPFDGLRRTGSCLSRG